MTKTEFEENEKKWLERTRSEFIDEYGEEEGKKMFGELLIEELLTRRFRKMPLHKFVGFALRSFFRWFERKIRI